MARFFARGTLLRQAGRDSHLCPERPVSICRVASSRLAMPRAVALHARQRSRVLEQAGLGLADAVSVTTYLRRAVFAIGVPQGCAGRGPARIRPTAIVVADICRPEWLCEIELVAGPAPGGRGRRTMGRRTRKTHADWGATA